MDFFRQGRLDELAQELASDELSDEARETLGRIHPTFMGGEYLPAIVRTRPRSCGSNYSRQLPM